MSKNIERRYTISTKLLYSENKKFNKSEHTEFCLKFLKGSMSYIYLLNQLEYKKKFVLNTINKKFVYIDLPKEKSVLLKASLIGNYKFLKKDLKKNFFFKIYNNNLINNSWLIKELTFFIKLNNKNLINLKNKIKLIKSYFI